MRYTPSLEEVCSEHLACLNCKGLDKCPNRLKGYKYTPMLDKSIITISYDMCSNKIKQDKEDAYKKNLDLFDMPKDIKDATFIGMYKDDKNRLPIIKYFKEKDLRNMLQDLTDLDYNFKNGKIDLQVGMETILCRYCSN